MPKYYDTYEQETLSTLNTRTGVKKVKSNYSSYWMDFDDREYSYEDSFYNTERIVKLASVRRAVANFVRILTNNEKIDVVFSSGKDSYTDGKKVVIAAEEDSTKFDSMVGLALHEGAHCLLSDFNLIRNLVDPKDWAKCVQAMKPELRKMIDDDFTTVDGEESAKNKTQAMQKMLGMIMNVIEDRRIDSYVYQNAAGYRPYYDAMYTKYFFNNDVTKNLKHNPNWRVPTFQNYANWLINIFHPAFDRNALPGLSKMVKMIDLKNIRRFDVDKKDRMPEKFSMWNFTKLDTPWMTSYAKKNQVIPTYYPLSRHPNLLDYDKLPLLWRTANDILHEIIKHIANYQEEMKQQSETGNGEGEGITIDMNGVSMNVDHNGLENLDMSNTPAGAGKFNERKAADAMKKMEQALAGKMKKKQIKSKEKTDLDNIENSDSKIVETGDNVVGKFPCLVMRRVTKEILDSKVFPFSNHRYDYKKNVSELMKDAKAETAVVKGVQMGQILAHRLQVRNDPQITHFTRQPHGRIDRRILAQLGMDIEQVFKRTTVDNFKPVMIHLSIDASGSMGGNKFYKCLTVSTALAYVASKVKNIEVVITLRGDSDIPMVAVVYDSRKDNFQKVRNMFPYLHPTGSTPEGLCFGATLDMVTECAGEYDVFFINFSDGEPGTSVRRGNVYLSYGGNTAYDHTRRQVMAMREAGVKVMSYFITDYDVARVQYMSAYVPFKKMYGEDAVFVNVQNITDVLRTLNKLLLKKV